MENSSRSHVLPISFTFMQQEVGVCVPTAIILLKSTGARETDSVCLAPVLSHAHLTDTGFWEGGNLCGTIYIFWILLGGLLDRLGKFSFFGCSVIRGAAADYFGLTGVSQVAGLIASPCPLDGSRT